ncbi:uncharacterized protein TRIVIDRAFT_156525 [Trichoderma virens Gv29-8]|uniref:Uncharacterized protein n=1 Tax=Hypocrea virens (strain Gv29-8 / FGSC 10586) TaxID=413071 RepID=G9N1A3_HYPVG|nr:uncharacterized protein TRIVIDRAFT_156525 [Trichoderma virens Gv29-8]EHK19534.1 hypothetical protein TRIVIDRAFT_156525 [Trichoderma virens Gv29-8]UKZ58208.1 hypothetical protein TrVGV298_012075 [Trichoderma virens]
MKLDTLSSSQATSIDDAVKALCKVAEPAEPQFVAFRRFYQEITHFDQIGDISISINKPGLTSHADVLQAVSRLKSQYKITLDEFQKDAFPDRLPKEREKAVKTTVQLAFMIDPFSKDGFPMAYGMENDVFPVKWLPDQTFIQFFNTAFPTDPLGLWHSAIKNRSLTAWKLKRRVGIQIFPTNDLAQHLVYNPTMKTLAVFHQVEYLKAQIGLTKHRSLDESAETSFANGTLPPQLLLETLYSIYYILIPLSNCNKSLKLAKKLTRANNDIYSTFDPNLLANDGMIRQGLGALKFIYWAKRLRVLQAILKHPPPSNNIVSWFERHTSERNAITVAILGLFLTALFGLLSFLVGVAQLVVSLKQSNLNS